MRRSKNFSNRGVRYGLSILLLLVWIGCAGEPPPKPPLAVKPPPAATPQPETKESRLVPPWHVWLDAPGGPVADIDALTNAGKLDEAYASAKRLAAVSPDEELLSRLFSLELQLGRSDEVLDGAAQYSKRVQKEIDQFSPNLDLLVGYAYLSKHDIDQALAWFGLVLRRAAGTRTGNVAGREIQSLLNRIVDSALSQYAEKWSDDPTVRPFFLAEQQRRAQGGKVIHGDETDYYSPATYGATSQLRAPTDGMGQTDGNSVILAVSPAEGKFSEYGEAIRRGIDLAREELDPEAKEKIQFVEEERISESEPVFHGAKAIIGPLQLGAVDSIRSFSGPKVPIFTFVKRDRTARENIFPMNISLAQEGEALVEFSKEGLGAGKIILLLPQKTTDDIVGQLGKIVEVHKVAPDISSDELKQLITGKEVLLCLFPLEDYLTVVQQSKQLQPQMKIVGGGGFYDPAIIRSYVNVFEGTYILMPFFAESERPVVKRFVSRYRQRFQKAPDLLAALAYDTTNLVLPIYQGQNPDMVQSPQSRNPSARSGLKPAPLPETVLDLQGVTGIVSFSKKAGAKRHFTVLQVRDGEVLERGADYSTAVQ